MERGHRRRSDVLPTWRQWSTEIPIESMEPEHRSITKESIKATAGGRASIARGWRKIMFLGLAGVFFVLGALGAILPGLPATPFLLLTSYLLVRSSPRLNQRLMRSRIFGPILVDWQIHGGVRRQVKAKAVVVVVVTVALTIYWCGYSPVLTAAVIFFAAVGILFIYRLPVARDELDSPSSTPGDDHETSA